MPEPKIYTPISFLDAEYTRIKDSWFWRAFIQHVSDQRDKHTKLAYGHASGEEANLRVAAAMASTFNSVLDMVQGIRTGALLLPNQVVAKPPPRVKDNQANEEDTNAADE